MPPIPVHIEDPIAPTKAQGITPETQTEAAGASSATAPSTTTASSPTQIYAPAKPGQAAMPAPTSALPKPQPAPTRTLNLVEQADLPAPPQPGQAPQPNNLAFQTNATGIPPAAMAGSAPVTLMPAQAQWAPPQQNYAPTHATEPATPQGRGPTTLNMGPVTTSPASGPPGYQQNVYAQELSPAQRASLDQQEAREKQGNLFGDLSTAQPSDTTDNVWNAVKSFGAKAGESAAKVHGEVWKWIDGKP